jgi:hypothetical protein
MQKCARSCAVLRNFLRTWLQALYDGAFRGFFGRFCKSSAQLLAHNGHTPSFGRGGCLKLLDQKIAAFGSSYIWNAFSL